MNLATSGIHILFAVLMNNSAGALTSVTAEFSNKEACEKAAESIRQKYTRGSVVLLTCEKKSV